MGRKALHTQEEVFQAADALAANGKEVTPTTLRDALGGGSLTTIYKHIDAWQEHERLRRYRSFLKCRIMLKPLFSMLASRRQ